MIMPSAFLILIALLGASYTPKSSKIMSLVLLMKKPSALADASPAAASKSRMVLAMPAP